LVPVLGALPGVRRSGSLPPAWNVWLGVVLALSGVFLLAAPPGDLTGIGTGDLLSLGCAFAFAGHIIFQDRVSDKGAGKGTDLAAIPFEQLALLQVGFCTLFMAASTRLLEKPHVRWSSLVVVTLVIEALFATAAAFTIQSWAQKFLAPTYLVLIYAMEPVFAWLTSLAVLHQGLSARAGWGAVLILAGVLAAEFLGNRSWV
jgi:drug/metabolite transporter (DMT)-like permease